MRIGILTFHCAYNFGAVLQCYALKEYLSFLGHETYVINYSPSYLATKKAKYRFRNIISRHPIINIKKQIKILIYRRMFNKYQSFENRYLHLTKCISESDRLDEITHDLDFIIIGSDQIWNKQYNGNDLVWYGEFKGAIPSKIITYAASAGNNHNLSIETSQITEKLGKLKSVMVRENELNNLLSNYINSDCVLDPSLMVPAFFWEKFYNLLPVNRKKYIVTYRAREDENVFRIAKDLAKQLNADIITTNFGENDFKSDYKHKTLGPDEFVSLIKHACCVVTTSFHGTAFSIITQTPFYTLRLNDNADGRVENLLNSVGLMDRLIDKNSNPTYSTIDFKKVNDKLEVLRTLSQEKLKKSLES